MIGHPFPNLFMLRPRREKYVTGLNGSISFHEHVRKGALPIVIQINTTKTIMSLAAAPLHTTGKLKRNIFNEGGVAPFNQKHFFAGVELEDHCTISNYNILSESTIDLVLQHRGCMKIYVETTTGNKIPLEPYHSESESLDSKQGSHLYRNKGCEGYQPL